MEKWFDPVAIVNGTPDVFNPSKGIAAIGDALAARSERRLRREQANQQMDLEKQKAETYRQQVMATKSAQERADRALAVKTAQADARQRGLDVQNIGKAFGAGAPGQAQLVAASSQYENPQTHQLEGIKLAPKPNDLPNPATPSEPEAPAFVGPLETPDDAQARAMARGLGWDRPGSATEPSPMEPGAPGPEEQAAAALQAGEHARAEVENQQNERDQYGTARAAYPSQVAATAQAQADYQEREKNPLYRAQFPGGQTVDINPREQRDFADAEAKASAAKLREQAALVAQTDPNTARMMLASANTLDAGLSTGRAAPVTSMVSQSVANEARASEGALNRTSTEGIQNRHDAARLKAKAMGKGLGAGGHAPGSPAWFKEEGLIKGELNDYETQHQLGKKGGLGEKQQLLTDAYQSASEARQNPGMQILILDRLLRSASGLGVRQQMLQTYKDHLTGLLDRGEGVASEWLGTGMGQEQWNNVTQAIREELSQAQAQGGKENADFHAMVAKSPMYQRHADAIARREGGMFGGLHGYGAKSEGQPAAPAAAPAAHPKEQPVGATRQGPDGKTYRKVGPNNWQPVGP